MSYMKTLVSPTTGGELTTPVFVPKDFYIDDPSPDKVIIGGSYTPSPVMYTTVSPPKGMVLTAKARLNKGTMQAYGNEHAMQVVKHRLVKDLLEQLINSGVVKITSDISKTGAATFTATVVCNEAA